MTLESLMDTFNRQGKGIRFHHIGYAVSDIQEYLDNFMDPLFSPINVSEKTTDPIQKVTVCFVELSDGTTIELVEPFGDDSPVNSVLDSARGGLYHLCYEVDDLEREIQRFREKRCMPLGKPVPATAFGQRRIVFLMTPQRDLIELLESVQK